MAGFAPAQRSQAKARIGLYGVGGSGKTLAALLIARGLCPNGRYALADTEAGKSQVYSDDYPFDTVILKAPFTPPRIVWTIEQATAGGYDVLIIDGLTPFWSGPGGVLEVVDKSKNRGGGWAEGTPTQQKIVDALLGAPMHLIVTMRAKSDTLVEQSGGKTSLRKVGMKYDQRDNLEYDLGWLVYLEHGTHALTVEKTTMMGQQGQTLIPVEGSDVQPAEEFGKEIAAWLGSGAPAATPVAAPAPQEAPAPAAAPPAAPAPASAPQGTPEAASALDAPPVGATGLAGQEELDAIDAVIERLKAEKPDEDWNAAILPRIKEWYGADSYAALSRDDAVALAGRLEQTRLRIIEKAKEASK